MLMVTKRSGTQQEFKEGKIRASLAASSDEAKAPLNEGDLTAILGELNQLLDGKQTTTTRQIYIMVVGVLYVQGHHKILKEYASYAQNRWK